MDDFKIQMMKYHGLIEKALTELSLAKTYAEDGAPFGAQQCALRAAEFFKAAGDIKNAALKSITVEEPPLHIPNPPAAK